MCHGWPWKRSRGDGPFAQNWAAPQPGPTALSPEQRLLTSLAAIVVLGVGAQWLAWRLRLPSILLLLLLGLAVGPGSLVFLDEKLLDPSLLLGDLLFPVVSLSVAVILFEGGLTLDLRELRHIGRVLARLVTVGVAVTWLLAATLGHHLAGLPWGIAILLGALLTVTGPTVVGPLLRHVRPKGGVGPVATWEGIAVDVIGASLAVLVFHALEQGSASAGDIAQGLLRTLAVGTAAGFLGALVLALPLRRHWIPDALQSPAALATVLGIYTLADHVAAESGLLAVTLLGVVLRNQQRTPVKHIIEFKENLRTLLISSLFLVLAARIDLHTLASFGIGDLLFVLALVLVVRPAAVWLSTVGSGLPRAERIFLAFLAPRGIVAVAISALFGERLAVHVAPGFFAADRLAPLTFLVVIVTVTVYGLAAAPLARRLGLADSDPQGLLLIGAGGFSRALARALAELGLTAIVVDTNRASVAEARLEGIEAVHANALAEDAEERLPLGGVGRLLALTPNHEVNSLAALHFTELFGRSACYQLVPGGTAAKSPTPKSLRGRYLFDPGATFADLARRIAAGHQIKSTPLTETFDAQAWREIHGPEALPLFRVQPDGELIVVAAQDEPAPAPGEFLVGIVPPENPS